MINDKIIEDHYKKHFQKLCKKYSFMTGSPENGEDVVQEAYARALKYLISFNRGGDFQHWFSRIIRNTFLNFKIEQKRGVCEEFDEELVEGTLDSGYYKIFAEEIFDGIEDYPEHIKEVSRLYFKHGFSSRDIHKITGLKKRSIEQLLYRFKIMIREIHGESMDRGLRG